MSLGVTNVKDSISGSESISYRGNTSTVTIGLSHEVNYTNGTGANQAGVSGLKSQTNLAASASDSLDLTAFPAASGCNFTGVKELMLKNTGTVTLKLEDGAATAWSSADGSYGFWKTGGEIYVAAGGCLRLSAPTANGVPVGASNKLFKVTNTSGSTAGAYELLIIGEEA